MIYIVRLSVHTSLRFANTLCNKVQYNTDTELWGTDGYTWKRAWICPTYNYKDIKYIHF